MKLQYSELDKDIRLIKLVGKLDILGTSEVETKFAGIAMGKISG